MKKKFKRFLSAILSVAMVLTLIPLGTVWASAASSRTVENSTCGDFKFVVPETIYLYPDLASNDVATSTGFQYYINETTDYAVSGTYDTTGKIYFAYSTAQNATLSWSFVDTSFNTMSGGSVTASATSLGTSATVNITGGKSPSLAAGTQGCYIQWCISYTDSADGVAKKAYNYTYVYKPFIRVVAAATEIGTGTSSGANWAGSVTWISGMNSFTSSHTNLKDYDKWDSYSCGYTKNNFAAFISQNSTIYANGTAVGTQQRNSSVGTLSTSSNATNWYVVSESGANGYYLQKGNNNNPDMYYGGYTDNNNCNFVTGRYRENNKDLSGCVQNKTIAELKVDTSRYSNLSQIPNLAIGLTVTDDETSDSNSATWYIADASDCTFGDAYYKWHDDEDYYGNYNTIIAGQCAGGKWSRAYWECEGIRYVGQWYRALKGSTGTQGATATYYVHGYYANKDKAGGSNYDASNNTVCQLRTTYYNKSNLRSAIKNAELAMAKLGVNNVSTGYIKSAFFDDDANYKWTAFRNAYRAAIIGFTQIGNTSNMNTLATTLNNAINALCTKVTLDANGGSQSGTTSQYVTIGTNQTVSVTPRDWSGYSAPTRTGYTFQGWATSSTATSGATSVTVGYNNTLYAIWEINQYYFDLNGVLDGTDSGNIAGYGTADIYIGGSQVANDVADYYTQHNYGTAFEIKDIKAAEGHTYEGVDSRAYGSLTGSIAAYNSGVYLKFHTNHYNVDFNGNGSTGGSTASKSNVLYTDSITLPNGFTKSSNTVSYNYNGATGGNGTASANINYTFAGWAKSAVGNVEFDGTSSYSGLASKTTDNETLTLYAKWNRSSVTLPTPTKTGYTFGGWYSDSSFSTFVGNGGASYSPDSSVTLYAKWTKNSFYLHYNGNKPTNASGSVANVPANTTLTYDTGATLGGAPTLTGYTFGGWYADSACSTPLGAANYQLDAADVNYIYAKYRNADNIVNAYAKWTPITYTVAYDANGGTGTTASSTHTYDSEKSLTSNGFSKTGYSFAGWATSQNGSVVYGDGQSVKNLASTNTTVTLYAKWTANKITVSFGGNGATGGTMNSEEFTYDTAKALNENKFVRSYTITYNYNGADGGNSAPIATASYSFNGWNNQTNGDGDYTYTDKQTVTNPNGATSGSTTLYAKWTGGKVTLPTPTRTGYQFDGWYLKDDFTGDKYGSGTIYTATSDVIFYAKWNPNEITLSYEGNGNTGGTVPADSTFYYGSTVHTANALTREIIVSFEYNGADGGNGDAIKTASYAFLGWKSSTGSKKTYSANTDVTDSFEAGNANVVQLTAQWDNSAAGIVLPTPTRTGYTFDGWYDNSSFNGTKYNANASYTPATNVKMYAKWVANSFSVKYDSNGKTVTTGTMPSVGPYTLKYDSQYEALNGLISPLIPKATNNVFIGWNTKADGTGTTYYPNTDASKDIVNAMYMAAGNKSGGSLTLYAQWKDVTNIEPKSEVVVDEKIEYGIENEEYDVFTGLEYVNGEWEEVYDHTELKYDVTTYTTYQSAADTYYTTKTRVLSEVNGESVKNFLDSADNLVTKVTTLEGTLKNIYSDIFDNGFTVDYNGSTPIKGISEGRHTLADMNLNHYTTGTLNSASAAKSNGTALLNKKVDITDQPELNGYVKEMANAFVSKAEIDTAPTYKMYDVNTPNDVAQAVAAQLGANKDVTGVNYVFSSYSGYTYYCYTNNPNPVIALQVNEKAAGGRVCYPTTAETTTGSSNAVKFATQSVENSTYDTYLANGLGTALTAGYYKQQTVAAMNPTFTADKQEVVYKFKAYDDAYAGDTYNYAATTALTGGLSGQNDEGDIQTISQARTKKPTDATPEDNISVVICYKSDANFYVYADENLQWANDDPVFKHDLWLNKVHLYRSSGGASNSQMVDRIDGAGSHAEYYKVVDPDFGQNNYGSFVYVFDNGTDSAANCTINISGCTTNDERMAKVKAFFKNPANFEAACKKGFSQKNQGGTGLGYLPWLGSNWSIGFYPKGNAYVYVHLIDRWGNVAENFYQLPGLDYSPSTSKSASAGSVVITEDGGSGIDTASINANSIQIIADDESELNGNVYTTPGNTVKIYTGEPNKSYTLTLADKATNKSTATVKTDADGYITISVDDLAYDFSGGYTFTLNGYEITIYDGVSKHIKSIEEVVFPTSEDFDADVVTSSDVSGIRVTDEYGDVTVITEYTENADGTRTFVFGYEKYDMALGEHSYKIEVKVGDEWLDEGDVSKLTVNKDPEEYYPTGTIIDFNCEYVVGQRKTVNVTVADRANMIQFIELDHGSGTGTRSYDRYNDNVTIVSYNRKGEVVSSTSKDLAYEIWTVKTNLADGRIGIRAKTSGSSSWESDEDEYIFNHVFANADSDLISASLEKVEGAEGGIRYTVVAGPDVESVQVKNEEGETSTKSVSQATVNEDGTLTFTGKVWFHGTGTKTATVRILDAYGWKDVGTLTYEINK